MSDKLNPVDVHNNPEAVSYTHLDVYKRQEHNLLINRINLKKI